MTNETLSSRSELLRKGKLALRQDASFDVSKMARRAGITANVYITFDAYQSFIRAPKKYFWAKDARTLHELLVALKIARGKQPKAIAFEFSFWVWTTTGGSMETKVLAVFHSRGFARPEITIAKPTECRVFNSHS